MQISGRSTQSDRVREKSCRTSYCTANQRSAIPHGASTNCIRTVADFSQPDASPVPPKSDSQKFPPTGMPLCPRSISIGVASREHMVTRDTMSRIFGPNL